MEAIPPELFGRNIKEIARLCRVSERTAKRWKQGTMCPPETALMVLRGDLGMFDPEWRGWILRRGCLISPESWEITRNDVLATPLMRSQLAIYQSENRGLKRDLAEALMQHLDEQPTPDQWDVEILTG